MARANDGNDGSTSISESTYHILLSLSAGPCHGYAVMKRVEAESGGRVRLSTGTLYGALKRLLDDGWIERVTDEGQGGGRPRKVYRLTAAGGSVLAGEVARLRGMLAAAERVAAGQAAAGARL